MSDTGCANWSVPMQMLSKKRPGDAAAKRASDGLVSFLCKVDVRIWTAADQVTREKMFTWLKSLPTYTTKAFPTASQVLSALEQTMCQQPKPAGLPALAAQPLPVKPKPAVKAEQAATDNVQRPGEAAVSFLKDGRISQSTLEMFDLGSVLKDDDASALLLDESKLAQMPPDKVRTSALCFLPVQLSIRLSVCTVMAHDDTYCFEACSCVCRLRSLDHK